MNRLKKSHEIVFLFLFLLAGIMFPPGSDAFRYQNSEQGHDFFIIGLGVFRQNYTSSDDPDNLFEESDDGLPEAYSNRSRYSIYGEGRLFNDYTFLLKSHYDEEADSGIYEDDFRFLFELNKEKHFMILGDHEDGTFQDTVFTALDEHVRGMTLHGGFSQAGATVMTGVIRGETTTDTIRGDGTSGPYRLNEAPVIAGSETVTIEIRDRANPNRVIQQRSQVRGQDYRIDYDDGEITFDRPVDEQDFRGNPTFIVVTYQYDSPGDRFKRAAWGTRLVAEPSDSIRMGVSYLADGPWEDNDSGDALDNRRQIYGTDLSVKFTDRYQFGVEVARSEIPELEDTLASDATIINVDTNPVDPLHIYGRYWRVERDFLSFGNLNLQSDNVVDEIDLDEPFSFKSASLTFDLDPNISVTHGTDEESYGLSAAYDLNPYHTLSTGFRETKNNIPGLVDTPQISTRSLFASYKRIHPEKTDWLLAAEKIDSESDDDTQELDTTTNRLLGAVKYPLGSFRFTGATFLQFAYQLEDFNDQIDEDNDTQIHDALGRFEIHPIQEVTFYLEQGEQFIYEEVEDDYTLRKDISMVGVQGIFNRYADLDASARYSRETDLVADETSQTDETYRLRWTSRPLDVLKTRLKFEYDETDERLDERVRTRNIFGGEVFWDIFSNLLATVKYEYETNETTYPEAANETATYDDLVFRLDYKFRRSLSLFGGYRLENEAVKAPPLDTTETQTTTWLFGAKYQINDRWDILSSYKYKMIDESIKDKRQKFFTELGYQLYRFLKISVGYEYIDYIDEDTSEAFETHNGYVSLTGTF